MDVCITIMGYPAMTIPRDNGAGKEFMVAIVSGFGVSLLLLYFARRSFLRDTRNEHSTAALNVYGQQARLILKVRFRHKVGGGNTAPTPAQLYDGRLMIRRSADEQAEQQQLAK